MPDLALDDISLHFEVDGDGPPMLLLAGMLSDSASWGPLVPLLTPHFTIIRPDNRTTGRTRPWDAPVSVQQSAKDAEALMRHLGHERYHVVGHSMGGIMAMELANAAPDAVASLTIMASTAAPSPRTMAVFDNLLAIRRDADDPSLWLKALYPWAFRPGFFKDPDFTRVAVEAALAYPHAQGADAMALQIENLRNYRPSAAPSQIASKTLVLLAEHETLIPLADAKASLSQIPNAQVTLIPDAGHSAHWDAPQPVAEKIIGFAKEMPL